MPKRAKRSSQPRTPREQEETQEQSSSEEAVIIEAEATTDEAEPELEPARRDSINGLLRKYTRVVTQPTLDTFRDVQGNASWGSIRVQILLLLVISLLPYLAIGIPSTFLHPVKGVSPVTYTIVVLVGTPIYVLLGFFADTTMIYFAARAIGYFSGRITKDDSPLQIVPFKTVCYTIALFYVPIGIITTILSLFLSLNSIIANLYPMIFLAASLYLTALMIVASMALFELTKWKAAIMGIVIVVMVAFIYNDVAPIPYYLLQFIV